MDGHQTTKKALKSFKETINGGNLELSEIEDPRILVQGLLDYFDHFTTPAIHNRFIDLVHAQVSDQDKLTKEMREQMFNQLDKKEFLLIECFANFFSKVFDDEGIVDHGRKAVLRLCISLLLERKKWDKLFLKRSIIQGHQAEDKINYLQVFILKWIENFTQEFTDYYMVAKSPLKITEKRVQEKIANSPQGRGKYLESLIRPAKPTGENSATSTKKFEFQAETDEIVTNKNSDSSPISPFNIEQANQEALTPQKLTRDSPEDSMRMGYHFVVNGRVTDPTNGRRESESLPRLPGLQSPDKSQSRFMTQIHKSTTKLNDSGELQERTSLSNSPFAIRIKTRVSPQKLSFLKVDENLLFVGENKSKYHPESVHTIGKNLDDFFLRNEAITEENAGEKAADVPPFSDRENFDSLVAQIDGLSAVKQDFVLRRLLKQVEGKVNA